MRGLIEGGRDVGRDAGTPGQLHGDLGLVTVERDGGHACRRAPRPAAPGRHRSGCPHRRRRPWRSAVPAHLSRRSWPGRRGEHQGGRASQAGSQRRPGGITASSPGRAPTGPADPTPCRWWRWCADGSGGRRPAAGAISDGPPTSKRQAHRRSLTPRGSAASGEHPSTPPTKTIPFPANRWSTRGCPQLAAGSGGGSLSWSCGETARSVRRGWRLRRRGRAWRRCCRSGPSPCWRMRGCRRGGAVPRSGCRGWWGCR